jgi:hypothetical protein
MLPAVIENAPYGYQYASEAFKPQNGNASLKFDGVSPTQEGYDVSGASRNRVGRHVRLNSSPTRIAPPLESSRGLQRALESLRRMKDRAQRDRRFKESMNWLAANRQQFRGQWVALEGGHLLASGRTGKELYAAIGRSSPAPLVVQVEADDFPFGGW